tara:strand:- start:1670 stop:2212 length:543 start_codon:yes stop_codon:yes gene_type:complete
MFLATMMAGVVAAKPVTSNAKQSAVNKNTQFYDLVSQSPYKNIRVKISFTNDVTLSDIQNVLHKEMVAVKAFYHGTSSYTGGYRLQEGETLEEAIASYQRDHIFFIKKRIEAEEMILQTTYDKTFQDAVIQHIREAVQMRVDFEKNGVRIIAIEVEGFAIDVAKFSQKNIFVHDVSLVTK